MARGLDRYSRRRFIEDERRTREEALLERQAQLRETMKNEWTRRHDIGLEEEEAERQRNMFAPEDAMMPERFGGGPLPGAGLPRSEVRQTLRDQSTDAYRKEMTAQGWARLGQGQDRLDAANVPGVEESPAPRDTTPQSRRMFGGNKSSVGTDRAGNKYEAMFPIPGTIYDPADMPFDLQSEMSAAYDDSVNVSGLPFTAQTGRLARDAVLAQYDQGLAQAIGSAMERGIGKYIPDPIQGDYHEPKTLWKDPRMSAVEIFGKAIKPALADGEISTIEHKTIKESAKSAGISIDELLAAWDDKDLRDQWWALDLLDEMQR